MANRRRKGRSSNRFSLLGLQNHCGWWLPPCKYKCLLLGRKVMTSPDSKWKSKDNFANKSLHSQSNRFSSSHVRMWKLDHKEGWTPKNWCFWIVVLEKTLESLLDSKVIKSVNPNGNQPEYILEGLMLKLKLQYFGHLMQRTDSLEKTLMLGKIEGNRKRRWQKMRWLDGTTNSMDMNLGEVWKMVRDREASVLQSLG